MELDQTKVSFVKVLSRGYTDEDGLIAEALDPKFSASLSYGYKEEQLIAIMWALGRFAIHIQYMANAFGAVAHRKKRAFEKAKRDTIINNVMPDGIKTEKAKEDYAYSINPDLLILENEVSTYDTDARLYEKMPDRIQELIQIIKREIDRKNRWRGSK